MHSELSRLSSEGSPLLGTLESNKMKSTQIHEEHNWVVLMLEGEH